MSQTTDINAALRRLREDNDRLREALREVEFKGEAGGCPDCCCFPTHVRGCLVGDALAATPATGDPLLPCVECPSCGFAYARQHFTSGDACPECEHVLIESAGSITATPPDTLGRTQYDVAHAVALKDAERDVIEAAKRLRDVDRTDVALLGPFDRRLREHDASVDALRALEGGQVYNDDGCTTPEGYEG